MLFDVLHVYLSLSPRETRLQPRPKQSNLDSVYPQTKGESRRATGWIVGEDIHGERALMAVGLVKNGQNGSLSISPPQRSMKPPASAHLRLLGR